MRSTDLQDLLVDNIESIQSEIDKNQWSWAGTSDLFVLQLEAINKIVDLELVFGDSSDCTVCKPSYIVSDMDEVEDVL